MVDKFRAKKQQHRREPPVKFVGGVSISRGEHQYLWALAHVMHGYRARRTSWQNDDPQTARLYIEKARSRVSIVTADGKRSPYRPSIHEILTTKDWVVE